MSFVAVVLIWAPACDSSPAPREPAGSTFHQAHLAEGETSEVAALLIDVPGYRYLDTMDWEIQGLVARWRQWSGSEDLWSGGSLHSVVDRQGAEVAFLQLSAFVPGVLPDVLTAKVASAMWWGGGGGGPPDSRSTIADRPVFLFEDPVLPDSRYTYVWQIENTIFVADSGDNAQILRWIRAYLSRY